MGALPVFPLVQRCLTEDRGSSPDQIRHWERGIFAQIQAMMHLQGELTVDRMCYLARVSRASFYRYLGRKSPVETDLELRSQMQQLSVENRLYGYRRIGAGLRRKGFCVNHKKVLRLTRADNLLVVRKRKFVVTTQSRHALPVYANHVPGIALSRPNQLWVADITYIRLQNEFVYLGGSGCLPAQGGGMGAGP